MIERVVVVGAPIAGLGIEMSEIRTLGNLQAGVSHALALRGLQVAPIVSRQRTPASR